MSRRRPREANSSPTRPARPTSPNEVRHPIRTWKLGRRRVTEQENPYYALAKHIVTNVENNKFIGSQQFEFRRGCSTVMQLIEATHNIVLCTDSDGQVDVVFLDFSRAFDHVPHPKLLHKLKYIPSSNHIFSWFEAYLIGSEHFV